MFLWLFLLQTPVTAGRHSCINDSLSQSHSTLHLRSHYMGEIKGMIAATQLMAKASNGQLGYVLSCVGMVAKNMPKICQKSMNGTFEISTVVVNKKFKYRTSSTCIVRINTSLYCKWGSITIIADHVTFSQSGVQPIRCLEFGQVTVH